MTFRLTLAHVRQAALKAHTEGRLCAQTNRDPSVLPRDAPAQAYYTSPAYPGTGCAVGVALPPEVATALQASADYRIRANLDLVTIDPAELDEISKIQDAHDQWASYTGYTGTGLSLALKAEEEFLSLIR